MSTAHASERPIELDAVVRTALLQQRAPRLPDYEAENRALGSLAQVLANPPPDILQRLVEATLELCRGGSAGISIIEDHLGEKIFRWHALTGALASHRWGTTPRDFSPCGTVIDRNAVQLMYLPERHFLYFANVKPQIVEALLVPFSVRGQPVGTVWVVTHDDSRKFDAEDERVVKELGRFATEAYELASSVHASKISDRRKDELLATLAHELRRPPFETCSATRDTRDPAHDSNGFTLPPTSVLGEQYLRSMKQAIADLLERTRTNFEAISATSDPTTDRDPPWANRGPPVAARKSAPLPRGPARERAQTTCEPTALLGRMRQGDQLALEELYDCTVGSVYALALAILKSTEDAQEVVCDTYAQAWRQSERFDAERSSPIGWLMMMCRSRSIDRLRHNRSRGARKSVGLETVCEVANEALTADELLSLFQQGSRVQTALATLSPQRLKLVGLAFFEGLSSVEMAQRTGLPLGTVKSHIRRALVELRRKLQSDEQPPT